MKYLYTLLLLALTAQVHAQVRQEVEVSNGPLRFTKLETSRSVVQQSIKVGSDLVVTFSLSAVSDEKGYERMNAPSEVTNNTGTMLHYVSHVALLDANDNVVTTIGSQDVFSVGVRPKNRYQFGTSAVLPKGRFKAITSYRAVLYVSEQPLQPVP